MKPNHWKISKFDLIPWRKVKDWHCLNCGRCCFIFDIPIDSLDYHQIITKYGYNSIRTINDEWFLQRWDNYKCLFLEEKKNGGFCTIHEDRPYTCRVFPFVIRRNTDYGNLEFASLFYKKETFCVYLTAECPGIVLGEPSETFKTKTIPEFMEIRLGNYLIKSTVQNTI